MGLAWALALFRGALWLSVVRTLLSSACCSHARPGWRFTSSEVVIPRKVSHRLGGSEMPDPLSYSMRFRGQSVIHMKLKKNLLPRHFPIITDDDQGAMQEDYLFVPRDCYYYSYLEGVPGSIATLDTCSGGLRGMLQVDDFTYEIKPLEASSKFEHVVSLLVSEGGPEDNERCDIPGQETNQVLEEIKLARSPRAGPVHWTQFHLKNLNLHYTITKALYDQGTNITQTVRKAGVINNILHTIFTPVNLKVFVHILCIWTISDSYTINAGKNALTFISEFGVWTQYKIHKYIPHATSVLFTGTKIGGQSYATSQKGMYNPNWGALFVSIEQYHIFKASAITAHALGHNLGLVHDTADCRCFRRSHCVMAPVPGLLDVLSNCFYESIHYYLYGWDACLSFPNQYYTNFKYEYPRCGDNKKDWDEECDGGSLKDCANDICCETNCRLSMGSVCGKGDCCHSCTFAAPETHVVSVQRHTWYLCRDTRGICDLPEYCNGKQEDCPRDFYIQDETPCSPLSVCVRGNCGDRDLQCKALFGHLAKDAALVCYEKLNMIGDFGNCGIRLITGRRTRVKCEADDVLCGLLYCDGIEQVPGGGEHTTFCHLEVLDIKEQCFGYDIYQGMESPEMGLVVDGSTCGPGKYCLNQNCTFHQDVGFNCDVKKCNFKGVCNNNNTCHCLRGWRPPTCEQKEAGGRVDSGPPLDKKQGIRAKILVNINQVLLMLVIRIGLFLFAIIIGGLTQAKRAIEKKIYEDEFESDSG
ncbi:LOW QUALITY PROTEIN: disintegrin and metalloproteinase domain-containing protein 20-like [Ctenodactylus gundi]